MYRNEVGNPDGACNRCDIADEIEIEFLEDRSTDCVRCSDIKERIAVGRRPHGSLSADIAAATRPVVDNKLLTEPLRQPLTDQTCDDVRRGAGGIGEDQP